MTELIPASEAPLSLAKERARRLSRNAMRSAYKASEMLPDVLERINGHLDQMSDKDLIVAGSFLERLAQHRALVAKVAQLGKHMNGGAAPAPTAINVTIHAGLPLEERLKRIEAEVRGVPRIEAVVVETTPSQPQTLPEPVKLAPARPEGLEVSPVPHTSENAAQDLVDRLRDL